MIREACLKAQMSLRNPVCCLHNGEKHGKKLCVFLSSIFTGTNCQRALNTFDHIFFYWCSLSTSGEIAKINVTVFIYQHLIIHMFHSEVAPSLIQANYGRNTLESGQQKHIGERNHSQRHSKNNPLRQHHPQQAALDNTGLFVHVCVSHILFTFTSNFLLNIEHFNLQYAPTSLTAKNCSLPTS